MLVTSALAAALLACIHFFANHLRFTHMPRSKWLSIAGGISVSYVFIHLLPELEQWQHMIEEQHQDRLSFFHHHLYLLALTGLVIFYGLEKAAIITKASHRHRSAEKKDHNPQVFWLHIGIFSFYNTLIGYLLVHRNSDNQRELLFFALAMAFHFIGNDYALLDHYRDYYLKKGRWVVAFSIIVGWLLGVFVVVPEFFIAIIFSLLAGSIILNVLKEELPEERKSNFWAFLLGVLFYSSILLLP